MSSIRLQNRLFSLEKPAVMGIINLTPDSFYAESRIASEGQLLKTAQKMLADGADILDVGAYSTRPNAPEVPEAEEKQRLVAAIAVLRKHFPQAVISADTFRANVAKAAVKAGADLINDVFGGQADAAMFDVIAELQVPYILMHARGTPQTMQQLTDYEDFISDITDFFQQNIFVLRQKGVKDIIIDPGFGFSKTLDQNFELLRKLPLLKALDCPILVGISRKSMIYKTLDISPEIALNGTTALHALALEWGASVLRVHDVAEAQQCVRLWQKTL